MNSNTQNQQLLHKSVRTSQSLAKSLSPKASTLIAAGMLFLVPVAGLVSAFAGSSGGNGSAAASAPVTISPFVTFNPAAGELPEGLAVDSEGDLRVAMAFTGEIKKVTRAGVVSHFAQLPGPHSGFSAVGLAMDGNDNVYVARATFSTPNTGVFKISADGSTVSQLVELPIGIPNALAFDEEGLLYVSDSLAGAIWRVTPDGQASIWIQDALLAGEAGPPLGIPVGANGIAFDKGQKNLYVAVTDKGRVVRVPLDKSTGAAGVPQVFVENLALLKGADGMAFDVRRNLYVAVNRQDRLVRIDSNGNADVLAQGGLLDFPATPAFGREGDEKTIFLSNFALFRARGFVPGAPSPKIIKVRVGIPGAELLED